MRGHRLALLPGTVPLAARPGRGARRPRRAAVTPRAEPNPEVLTSFMRRVGAERLARAATGIQTVYVSEKAHAMLTALARALYDKQLHDVVGVAVRPDSSLRLSDLRFEAPDGLL